MAIISVDNEASSPPGEPTTAEIAARATILRKRIAEAAGRSGRGGDEISILCVTKTHSASVVQSAYSAGLRDFGENYVQEALAKQDDLASPAEASPMPEARWRLIGHLQSNKTNSVAGRFALIESVDSLKLGQRIGRSAEALGVIQDVLIQVKLGGEETKSGIEPHDVEALANELLGVAGVRLRGLMAIAPLGADGFLIKEPRPFFAQAKTIFDQLPSECRQILSMGMSGDFESAIEEGSTCIRVGTMLLGNRSTRVRSVEGESTDNRA